MLLCCSQKPQEVGENTATQQHKRHPASNDTIATSGTAAAVPPPTAAVLANAKHFQWLPLAGGSITTSTSTSTRTLVVFDFDCTLTSVHLYHQLRQPAVAARLAQDSSSFYDWIFGGASRISALQCFLRTLSDSAGVKLRVLSFGHEAEITDALAHIGVSECFEGVHGSTSFSRFGVVGIVARKQQMLTKFQLQDPSDRVVFVDDDTANFPQTGLGESFARFERFAFAAVEGAPTDLRWRAAEQHVFPAGRGKDMEGLQPQDMQVLLEYVLGCAVAVDAACTGATTGATTGEQGPLEGAEEGLPPELGVEPAPPSDDQRPGAIMFLIGASSGGHAGGRAVGHPTIGSQV